MRNGATSPRTQIMTRFDHATRPQIAAADPAVSAWVMANAGTGKTRVLTNRVARLLVQGVAPERILCITYTNAAANEMSHRLMEIFSRWTMLPGEMLRSEIAAIGVDSDAIVDRTLDHCRTLMARMVDPGKGFNLSTVHAFAAAMLRKFPVEAGISPRFGVVDDREQTGLLRSILSDMAVKNPDLFAMICHFTNEKTFEALTLDIMQNAREFTLPPSQQLRAILRENDNPLAADETVNRKVANLVNEYNGWNDSYVRQALEERDLTMLRTFQSTLQAGGKRDQERATKIKSALEMVNTESFVTLCDVFLDRNRMFQPRQGFANKSTLDALGETMVQQLTAYADRLAELKSLEIAGTVAARTIACHRFADALLTELVQYQETHGSLFYDDLLMRLYRMLSDPQIADWILYRFDSAIDHILVDEAQDMNDRNWDIVSQLSAEFTAGSGQHEGKPRTIFSVGDSKQSIFGFQGANPKRFMEMSVYYERLCREAGLKFLREDLRYSFRSAKAVLDVVQHAIESSPVEAFSTSVSSRPYHEDLPGRVDLLGFFEQLREPTEETLFDLPEDSSGHSDKVVDYARHIIAVIREVLRTTIPTKDGPRLAEPGDILILVQTRSRLYAALTRELHQSGIPYSGTDRLNLGDQIVVKDLMALLACLACREDDFSLACVLRSPLCDISEEDLFDLAWGREGSLGNELRNRADENARFRHAVDFLNDLLTMENSHKPYDVIERVLTIHDGMQRFQGRLGAHVVEAIEILLDQALNYEESNESSLTGFVEWLDPETIDVARKMSQQANAVRVMTVHGAKGLESPIVILPDTDHKQKPVRGGLFFDPDGVPVWLEKSMLVKSEYRDIWQQKATRLDEEKLCLLYVAMTRAQSWLIVGGVGKKTTRSGDPNPGKQWYHTIESAMDVLPTTEIEYETDTGPPELAARRYETGTWPDETPDLTDGQKLGEKDPVGGRAPDVERAGWLLTRPGPTEQPVQTISPSRLGSDALPVSTTPPRPGNDGRHDPDAATRGTLIHRLLEILPDVPRMEREDLAVRIVLGAEPDYSRKQVAAIVTPCLALLDRPEYADIFGPDALSEVPVTARLDQFGSPMYGIIDKLVILKDKVLAVDFKSHSAPPESNEDIPTDIMAQMGVYRQALDAIYPDREVTIGVLWTETGEFMKVSRARSEAVLATLIDKNEMGE